MDTNARFARIATATPEYGDLNRSSVSVRAFKTALPDDQNAPTGEFKLDYGLIGIRVQGGSFAL